MLLHLRVGQTGSEGEEGEVVVVVEVVRDWAGTSIIIPSLVSMIGGGERRDRIHRPDVRSQREVMG